MTFSRGVDDLRDDEGRFDRPVDPLAWRVPDYVDTANGWLIWDWDADADPRSVRQGPSLLTEFAALANGQDKLIIAFARRWGPLRLCAEHALPHTHTLLWVQPGSETSGPCRVRTLHQPRAGARCEPISGWRALARTASAVLNIAGDLHYGRRAQESDWLVLYDALGVDESARYPRDADNQRRVLAEIANHWLRMGAAMPQLAWTGDRPSLTFDCALPKYGGLFPALAMQLVLATSNSKGIRVCADCRQPFVPVRRAGAGPTGRLPKYCDVCGPSGARRVASRRYRTAKRDHGATP